MHQACGFPESLDEDRDVVSSPPRRKPKRLVTAEEIVRPTPEMLAHDPSVIEGCTRLAQRVLIQAFEDAAQGVVAARSFLTVPGRDGVLAYWVKQAEMPMALSEFCAGAEACLKNPKRVSQLFSRLQHRPRQPSTSPPQEKEEHAL